MPRMNGETYCRQAASMEDLMELGNSQDSVKQSSKMDPQELERRIDLYSSRFDRGVGIFDGESIDEGDEDGEGESDIES